MSRYVKVEGVPGLVRDIESNALINVNANEIELAQKQKRIREQSKANYHKLEDTVETLQKDMCEIKEALAILLSRSI
jgi:N-glycosylase/DNA lyase|tara:strand:- start:5108 stop:5338 length:231 start_codon:yes stop_codon:yes gene_type:complete